MRLLIASDIHGSAGAVSMIKRKIEQIQPDVTVICGDITHFGTREEAKRIIDDLPGEVLAIPGNCDPPGIEEGVEDSHGVDIHGKIHETCGITFGGFGGAKKMFGTVREYDEEYLGENVRRVIKNVDVLVLHGPPYGINDLSPKGPAGSREILDAVREHSPMLVLSGHIHECHGIVREGGTIFINPGAARDGRFATLEIDETKNIREGSIRMME